jgi:DNA-binding NtrC family response regulator
MDKRAIVFATGETPTTLHWGRLLFVRGVEVLYVPDFTKVLVLARARRIDAAIVTAPSGSDESILQLLPAWRRADRLLSVVIVALSSSEDRILAAFRAGVSDYLREPVSDAELLACVDRVLQPPAPQNRGGSSPSHTATPTEPMIGDSSAIRNVRSYIERVARTDSNVLITGETGVGKEIVAGMIHVASPRSRRPCVSINCAAIPDTLLESELFGFERGAFTGADRGREGTLKSADGGTVFFDEIGDMPLPAQAKILRAIEAREVHPLGGGSRVPLDVRVIAATNQDVEELVSEGRFRKDLYYRLNVARIHLPPLRQRLEDLQPILGFFIRQLNRRFDRQVQGLTPAALEHLRRHDWPGNVRELKNLLEAIYVNLDGQRIDYIDLPDALRCRLAQPAEMSASERDRLVNVLFDTNWNKSKAAEKLNWSRMTLYRKLAKYHVVRDAPPVPRRS